MAATAASATAGWVNSADSTSPGMMLLPPRMIISFDLPDDPQEAIGVEVAEITALEPALLPGALRLLRLIEVLPSGSLAGDEDFAHFARRPVVAVVVDDAQA